jgi:hypothetical protein
MVLFLKVPSTLKGLPEFIQGLQADEGLRGRLGGNAVRTAQRYTWDSKAGQLRDIGLGDGRGS